MKKLLCLTVVLALVAPAMAAPSTNIWAEHVFTGRPANPTVDYSNGVTRVGGEWVNIFKFDVSGITDANDVGRATLWLRSNYFEDNSNSNDWQPIGDTDFYGKLSPVIQSWTIGDAGYGYRDVTSSLGWGDGNDYIDDSWDGSSPDMGASIADLYTPFDRGITLPDGPWGLHTGNPAHSLRYHMKVDITDLVKSWVDGSVPNYGVSVIVAPWLDGNSVRHGTNQANIKPNLGAPGAAEWGGNPVIEIVPEPATMSLLAIGGLAALIRRKR